MDSVGKVTISVERAINDALITIAEQTLEKHGILIQDVRFSWANLSQSISENKPNMALSEVHLDTVMMVGGKS